MKQYHIEIKASTQAETPEQALRIAMAQVADGTAFATVWDEETTNPRGRFPKCEGVICKLLPVEGS